MLTREAGINSARNAAYFVLRGLGIETPDQIELEDVAWARGVRIKDGRIDGAEAWLVRKGRSGIVRVSNRIRQPGRRRFAIAHELGHWECHKQLSQAWVCTAGDIHSYKGSHLELEANAFAAELLMPRNMLTPMLQSGSPTIAMACDLAEQFGTTLTASAVRLVEESREDCCVVFSQDDVVRWWKPSKSGGEFSLPFRFNVSDESSAWNCSRSPRDSLGPKEGVLSAWLPESANTHYSGVWEESVCVREYNTVITLLSFA